MVLLTCLGTHTQGKINDTVLNSLSNKQHTFFLQLKIELLREAKLKWDMYMDTSYTYILYVMTQNV